MTVVAHRAGYTYQVITKLDRSELISVVQPVVIEPSMDIIIILCWCICCKMCTMSVLIHDGFHQKCYNQLNQRRKCQQLVHYNNVGVRGDGVLFTTENRGFDKRVHTTWLSSLDSEASKKWFHPIRFVFYESFSWQQLPLYLIYKSSHAQYKRVDGHQPFQSVGYFCLHWRSMFAIPLHLNSCLAYWGIGPDLI